MRLQLNAIHATFRRLTVEHRDVLLLIMVALLFKGMFLVGLDAKPPNVDGIRYLRAAQEMAAGHLRDSLSIYRMPAYPFMIWVMQSVVQDWVLAARLLSALALLGAAWLLYRISVDAFDRRAALWACLAFLVCPMQNEMTVLIYRGPLYLFCFAGGVWLMMRAIRRPSVFSIVVAAWLGFVAALFRIEGAFLTPFFLLMLLVKAAWTHEDRAVIVTGVGAWGLIAAIGGIGFVLLGGGDSLGSARFDELWSRLRLMMHGEVLANYHRIEGGLKAVEAASPLPSQEANFGEIALNNFALIYLIGLCQLMLKVIYPVFIVPLTVGVRQRWNASARWLGAVLFAYLVMLYLALVSSDFSGTRFVFTASFLLYPWIGQGMSVIVSWVQRRSSTRLRWATACCLVFLVMPLWATMGKMETEDESSVAAGRWFARSEYRDMAIVGNDPRIPFAAGIPLYRDGVDQYLHFRPEDRDYGDLEQFALDAHRRLIFLKLRKTKLGRLPAFSRYKEIRRFEDDKKIVFVFANTKMMAAPETAR